MLRTCELYRCNGLWPHSPFYRRYFVYCNISAHQQQSRCRHEFFLNLFTKIFISGRLFTRIYFSEVFSDQSDRKTPKLIIFRCIIIVSRELTHYKCFVNQYSRYATNLFFLIPMQSEFKNYETETHLGLYKFVKSSKSLLDSGASVREKILNKKVKYIFF